MGRKIWLPKCLNYFMYVLMAVAVFSMMALPWIIGAYVTYVYPKTDWLFVKTFFLIAIYISGILALVVLNELRKIFKSCVMETPFIMSNVVSLKRIGFSASIIAMVFIAKAFVFLTILTLIVIFTFSLAALFCFVLADVFEEAVNHKAEIDLTI